MPRTCPHGSLWATQTGFPGVPPHPHQALLRDRGDQRAVAGEDQPARRSRARRAGSGCPARTAASRRRGTGGATRAHGRGSRAMKSFSNTRAAVRHQRGVEQRHVGGIGEHALMDRGIVGQLAGRADPDVEAAVLDLLAEIARRIRPAAARSAARARNSAAPAPASSAGRRALISASLGSSSGGGTSGIGA